MAALCVFPREAPQLLEANTPGMESLMQDKLVRQVLPVPRLRVDDHVVSQEQRWRLRLR